MATSVDKSVITCDLEGRIETFSQGAALMFGYEPGEIVGKKRVSLFSPGLTVLEHVPGWLQTAATRGSFEGDTVFVRKDGTRFPAHIRITPTKKQGVLTGYCGVTVPLPEDAIERAAPPIALSTRVFAALVITRAPFLTATLVPLLIGAALVSLAGGAFPWLAFALASLGGLSLHVAANVLNDYYDHLSGTDEANNDYFLPFSGGSRAIELGLISPAGLFRIGLGAFAVAALAGAGVFALSGAAFLLFGIAGAFAAFFYTAPPLRLVARKGLGELFVGLAFGPLLVGGMVAALTGAIDTRAMLVGIPVGVLTTAILWINEFPDAESDEKTGKMHLVVVLGKPIARIGFALLFVGAFAVHGALVARGLLGPATLIAPLVTAPLALYATAVAFRHYGSRKLVAANKTTIFAQALYGLSLAASIAFG